MLQILNTFGISSPACPSVEGAASRTANSFCAYPTTAFDNTPFYLFVGSLVGGLALLVFVVFWMQKRTKLTDKLKSRPYKIPAEIAAGLLIIIAAYGGARVYTHNVGQVHRTVESNYWIGTPVGAHCPNDYAEQASAFPNEPPICTGKETTHYKFWPLPEFAF